MTIPDGPVDWSYVTAQAAMMRPEAQALQPGESLTIPTVPHS